MESNILSINNYKDCVRCYYEKNKTYKISRILIQVMIQMSINKGMKKINLHDNSNYESNGFNIPLINLRTMTHRKLLYSKYGFVPFNHNKKEDNKYYRDELHIYLDNKKLFRTNPKITKKELISIIYIAKY